MKDANASILAQIMALDPSTAVFTDSDPSEETDEVLGVLSDDLKRFWVFLTEAGKKAREESDPIAEELDKLKSEHQKAHESGDHSPEDCVMFKEKARPLVEKLGKIHFAHAKIHDLFWTSVSLEFGLQEEAELSVRDGGVVVKTPPKPADGLRILTAFQVL
ncbi:MAG: hypothetical protein QG585_450 [Patescibacteria group bacterium]|jgi:hypothetical protein|nr:hypothetical protein [Patescibacteria group bacterium]